MQFVYKTVLGKILELYWPMLFPKQNLIDWASYNEQRIICTPISMVLEEEGGSDDGLLIGRLMRIQGISQPEAKSMNMDFFSFISFIISRMQP